MNDEKPPKRDSEEVNLFSDEDLQGYVKVDQRGSNADETQPDVDVSRQVLLSLKRQRRPKRSLMRILVPFVCLGIAGLAVFFTLKPETEKIYTLDERGRYPIVSIESPQEPTIPRALDEKGTGERGSEGAASEREALETEGKEEEKPQRGIIKEPKAQARPVGKVPTGRYSVNVASYRKRIMAQRLANELKEKGYEAIVLKATIPQKGIWYRVSLGRFSTQEEAQAAARTFKEKTGTDCFLTLTE